MKLNELEVKLIDDFSHQVTRKIDKYGDRPDFPNMDVYRIDRQELDGYLFDKQAILDMEGSPRSQYTLFGILAVIPILVLSAIPEENWPWGNLTVLAAIGCGLLLGLFIKGLMRMIISYRVRKMADRHMDAYINAVLSYEPSSEEE